jgi:zeaxanthin glucosyltransferase
VIADQLEPAGGLVAEHLGIPWISIADTLPMNREMGVPPPFVGWAYERSAKAIRRNEGGWRVTDLLLRGFNRTIARNARELGLPPRIRMEDCFSPLLQISQLVPGLDFPRSELPPTFHYVGPFARKERSDFTLPASERMTVYATLGTLQGSRVSLFRKIAAACARQRLRLILTHGGLAKDRPMKLPGDTLVFDWLPQRAALAQADLVVCHGGMNSVLDTLSVGLPLIVIPLAFEQPGIAARIAYSGAGLTLSRRASARSLGRSLARLRDDPSFRANAKRLREEIRTAGGVSRAAELIEQALAAAALPEASTKAPRDRGGAHGDSRSGSS